MLQRIVCRGWVRQYQDGSPQWFPDRVAARDVGHGTFYHSSLAAAGPEACPLIFVTVPVPRLHQQTGRPKPGVSGFSGQQPGLHPAAMEGLALALGSSQGSV